MSEYVAYEAITSLAAGLRHRAPELLRDAGDPQSIVSRTLAHIDRLDHALDEVLDEEPDDGLTAEQEIRARALDAAVRFDSLTAAQVAANAATFEEYIRDGDHHAIQRHYEAGLEAGRRLAAIDGQRRYHDGYREAVLRLADDERYEAWRESIVNPSAHPDVAVRAHLATYLGRIAPDWDDLSRDSAEERSDDPSKSSKIGD